MNRLATPIRLRSRQPSVAVPAIAATFDLENPAERRIFDIMQRFYGPDRIDVLHRVKRGTVIADAGLQRVVWTLGSFQPRRRGAKTEWCVITWNIDELEFRFRECKDQQEARALFDAL